jgi:hypothetical protein
VTGSANGTPSEAPPKAQMQITLSAAGQVGIQASTNDTMLMLQILAKTSLALLDHAAKSEGARLVSAVPGAALSLLRDPPNGAKK